MNTTKFMRWGLLAASVVISTSALAADWRVVGSVSNLDGLLLYSASDVDHRGGYVRVWTEVLSAKDVASFDLSAHPEAEQNFMARLKGGYRPPFSVAHQHNAQDMLQVALAEEVADEKASPILIRALYELDCAEGKGRILSFDSFPKEKPPEHIRTPQQWEFIPPDTPLADLKSWVCKKN
jgi:hypothetical protein